MTKLLGSGNSKMNKTAKYLTENGQPSRFLNFSIPAYKSATGKVTCPFADICVDYCYAQDGFYNMPSVASSIERRYEATKSPEFVTVITNELNSLRDDGRQIYVRVHDAGDFYSPEYRDKWFEIAKKNPSRRFYAYTKSHKFFKDVEIPDNFDIIFSTGSKLDPQLDKKEHKHAVIFENEEQLEKAGYDNCYHYDLSAKWFTNSNKIGLVMF